MKIALDAGHGYNTAGKRTPSSEPDVREWSLNNRVVVAMQRELAKYENAEVLRLDDPTGATDVDRVYRVTKATNWGADILVSVHHNAYQNIMSSGHGGSETYYQHSNSKELAQLMLDAINETYGLRNRGVKQKAFDIINYFKNPSTLVECGFMDSKNDTIIHDDKAARELGINMARAIANHYGLKRKENAVDVDEPTKPDAKPDTGGGALTSGTATIQTGAVYKSKSAQYNNAKVPAKHTGVPLAYKLNQTTNPNWVYFPTLQSYVDKSQVVFNGPSNKPTTPPTTVPSGKASIKPGAVFKSKSAQYNNTKVPSRHIGVPMEYQLNKTTNQNWVYFPSIQSYVDKSQVDFGGQTTSKDWTGSRIKMGNGTILRNDKGSAYPLKLTYNAEVVVLSQIGNGIDGNTLLRFRAPWLVGVTDAYVYLKDVRV